MPNVRCHAMSSTPAIPNSTHPSRDSPYPSGSALPQSHGRAAVHAAQTTRKPVVAAMDAYRSACQGVKNVSRVAGIWPWAHESRWAPTATAAERPTIAHSNRAGASRALGCDPEISGSLTEAAEIMAHQSRVAGIGCRPPQVGNERHQRLIHVLLEADERLGIGPLAGCSWPSPRTT